MHISYLEECFLSSSGTGKHDKLSPDYLCGKNTSETIYSNAERVHMIKLSQVNVMAFVAFLLNSFPLLLHLQFTPARLLERHDPKAYFKCSYAQGGS